jgi:hypothetical protein
MLRQEPEMKVPVKITSTDHIELTPKVLSNQLSFSTSTYSMQILNVVFRRNEDNCLVPMINFILK